MASGRRESGIKKKKPRWPDSAHIKQNRTEQNSAASAALSIRSRTPQGRTPWSNGLHGGRGGVSTISGIRFLCSPLLGTPIGSPVRGHLSFLGDKAEVFFFFFFSQSSRKSVASLVSGSIKLDNSTIHHPFASLSHCPHTSDPRLPIPPCIPLDGPPVHFNIDILDINPH